MSQFYKMESLKRFMILSIIDWVHLIPVGSLTSSLVIRFGRQTIAIRVPRPGAQDVSSPEIASFQTDHHNLMVCVVLSDKKKIISACQSSILQSQCSFYVFEVLSFKLFIQEYQLPPPTPLTFIFHVSTKIKMLSYLIELLATFSDRQFDANCPSHNPYLFLPYLN